MRTSIICRQDAKAPRNSFLEKQKFSDAVPHSFMVSWRLGGEKNVEQN